MKVKGIVKQWRFPEASERQLSRSIKEAVRDLVVFMRSKTKAMKFDATDQEISSAEDEIKEFAKELALSLIGLLPALASAVYKFNSKQWVNVAKSTGGANNPVIILLIAVGANQGEEWYKTLYGEWHNMSAASFDTSDAERAPSRRERPLRTDHSGPARQHPAHSAHVWDAGTPGAGAAGGTGFGLLAWGAELVPGAERVAERIGLADAIAGVPIS